MSLGHIDYVLRLMYIGNLLHITMKGMEQLLNVRSRPNVVV